MLEPMRGRKPRALAVPGAILLLLLAHTPTLCAQSAVDLNADATDTDPVITFFPHSQTAHRWVSGQDNIIFQWHPNFSAKYSGPNCVIPSSSDIRDFIPCSLVSTT